MMMMIIIIYLSSVVWCSLGRDDLLVGEDHGARAGGHGVRDDDVVDVVGAAPRARLRAAARAGPAGSDNYFNTHSYNIIIPGRRKFAQKN